MSVEIQRALPKDVHPCRPSLSYFGTISFTLCRMLSRGESQPRFSDDSGIISMSGSYRIEIDSTVERSIRPIALSRKNALFAGSDGGAVHWAVVASLIETCKLNEVEPLGYLADVLTRIVNGHPNSQIDDLLPWAYITAPQLKAAA
jgi:transposase